MLLMDSPSWSMKFQKIKLESEQASRPSYKFTENQRQVNTLTTINDEVSQIQELLHFMRREITVLFCLLKKIVC